MFPDTVIFDMDGLLIDSEPIWEEAGTALLASYGCKLTHDLYVRTTGLRTREWLQYWFGHFGIRHFNLEEAEAEILKGVTDGIRLKGKAMPGVEYILRYFHQKGFRMGLATSSSLRVANIVVEKLGIAPFLSAVTSAEYLDYGKPHPQVYLHCADALKAEPMRTICFEDSFNGMIAAKAAKMYCVVVPAFVQRSLPVWGAADLKISSLQNFNDLLLNQFGGHK